MNKNNETTKFKEQKPKTNLNINLSEDDFLRGSCYIIPILNRKGIKTIEDLLNYDQTKFSSNFHVYAALIQILKYKYLNDELINDVLLESKYVNNDSDAKQLGKDLKRLGYGDSYTTYRQYVASAYYILDKLTDLQSGIVTMEQVIKYIETDFNNDLYKDWLDRKETEFNVRSVSKLSNPFNLCFSRFYLDYIEQKKEKEQSEDLSPKAFEELKAKIETLVEIRDNLNKQIQDIENQINELSGGISKNGRK